MESQPAVDIKPESRWKMTKKMRSLYLMMLLPMVFVFIFQYIPIYGILIAFKDYKFSEGIWGSSWNNFEFFRRLFSDALFIRALRNTLRINLLSIIFVFPMPLIFALLLNELKNLTFKKTVQSISYLPYFMSWVVVGGFVYQILSPQVGLLNYVLSLFGVEPIYFMTKSQLFIPIFFSASLWQGVGWGSIVYLAAIASIDPSMYESAELDGANRFQKAIYITIPSISFMITILFLLFMAGMMSVGFDAIFNLYNPLVMDVADVIDTYIYRIGLLQGSYGFATAVGLFQSVIGVCLLVGANMVIKRFSEHGIW